MLLTMDAHRWFLLRGIWLAVWLDGRDVTTSCQCADDRHGWTLLVERDADGRIMIDRHVTNGPVRRLHVGEVAFVPRPWSLGRPLLEAAS